MKKQTTTQRARAKGAAKSTISVAQATPTVRRFETDVDVRSSNIKHKGVVYHVRHDVDGETILLAKSPELRRGYLMAVISPRDISAEEARKLINDYANREIRCQKCHRVLDETLPFRIDLRNGKVERVICAHCDPTVRFAAGFFSNMETLI